MIKNLDVQLTHQLQNLAPHNAFFDGLFWFFSGYGVSIAVWLVLFAFLYFVENKQDKLFSWMFLGSIFGSAALVEYVFKPIVMRARPALDLGFTVSPHCQTDFGFPSGHATVAFAALAVLWKFDHPRRYLYLAIALLVAYSRVYLGCHYFLDITAGALLGTLLGWLVTHLRLTIARR